MLSGSFRKPAMKLRFRGYQVGMKSFGLPRTSGELTGFCYCSFGSEQLAAIWQDSAFKLTCFVAACGLLCRH